MTVTILCSGFGLGFYTPGLLVEASLKRMGIPTDVLVFENVMQSDQLQKVDKSRQAYHADFSVALMSQRIPQDIRKSMDDEQIATLLQQWESEGRQHFICLSGHWIYILDRYREQVGEANIHVDLLYLDVVDSPSWKSVRKRLGQLHESYHEVWLFGHGEQEMYTYIDIPLSDPVIPYSQRQHRLLVHGGGWGMGTYRERIAELEQVGYGLDIILYDQDERGTSEQGQRYYRMNPEWRTWQQNEQDKHTFPPLGEVQADQSVQYESRAEYHILCEIERNVQAIVSKPGGGTLADSFALSTPIIFLEPFGEHEAQNAAQWEKYGFGLSYERWMSEYGGGTDILEQMHQQLLQARQQFPAYADEYIQRHMQLLHPTMAKGTL
ncbi:UDP-glucuronosyltransferase [Paenibacillus sp. PsM32]|uniref:UDP-glucuronosyltransferase n=1 Tax=Paenibacillus sp. PsM32 TaxID=3030536 RepID=UPI00263B8740|nr:UDP-glucuronosyltransferase [Paenibacillus sp. PsM32]MDN4616884.1 UDP-glucuronosyltransferase [Paenibacillus sp. PsM32]